MVSYIKRGMTPKGSETLAMMAAHLFTTGTMPNIKAIAVGCKIGHRSALARLRVLEKRGYIRISATGHQPIDNRIHFTEASLNFIRKAATGMECPLCGKVVG